MGLAIIKELNDELEKQLNSIRQLAQSLSIKITILKQRIEFLEDGLLEIRKIIENVHHKRVLSIIYEKTMELSYPEGWV